LVTATITPALNAGTITGGNSVCLGSTLSLSSSGGTSGGHWSSSNTLIASIDTHTGVLSTTSVGSVTITYEVTGSGCTTATTTQLVTVNALPVATISAGGATSFCEGGSVVLTASSGSSYLWGTGATTQSITVTSTGNYTVTVTNGSGCSATSSSTSVTVNALPVITIEKIDSVTNSSIVFKIPYSNLSLNTTKYKLINTNPVLSGFLSIDTSDLSSSPLQISMPSSATGKYGFDLTIINPTTGCSKAFPINLTVYEDNPVAPVISGSDSACSGTVVNLSATNTPESNNPWISSDTSIAKVSSTGRVTTVAGGSTNIIYTDSRGRKDTLLFKVIATPELNGSITGECPIPYGIKKIYTIAAGSNIDSYKWTVPNGWKFDVSSSNTINIYADKSNGRLTVTPFNGTCTGVSKSIDIKVVDLDRVDISSNIPSIIGDSIQFAKITMKMWDVEGKVIQCNNAAISFETNNGGFDPIDKLNDSVYTSYIKAYTGIAVVRANIGGGISKDSALVNFTGPQGSLLPFEDPIIKGESPSLRFKFTEGSAPYTVIYKAGDGAAKTDTLKNVYSDSLYTVSFLDKTTRFRVISIIGANLAQRNKNFIVDTATVTVLIPKVVVTLNADQPKQKNDSTFNTSLTINVKNTGNIDLNTVQVQADLTAVFPLPSEFQIDSVLYEGKTITLNSSFDGSQNTNLFSWNDKIYKKRMLQNKHIINIQPSVYENTEEHSLDFSSDEQSQYQSLAIPIEYEIEEIKEDTYFENGNFWGTLSNLPIGQESKISIYLSLRPNGYDKPYVMQVAATGTARSKATSPDAPVALTSSVSTDATTAEQHPELTNIGEPIPTIISLAPRPVIGVALNSTLNSKKSNGIYDIRLTYTLKNHGNANLKHLSIYQNIAKAIPSPSSFSIKQISSNSTFIDLNKNFDGIVDTNLVSSLSMLPFDSSAQIYIDLAISPAILKSRFRISSNVSAYSTEGNILTTDESTSGMLTDINLNGLPEENLVTIISIDVVVDKLKSGSISFSNMKVDSTSEFVTCEMVERIEMIPSSQSTGGFEEYAYQWEYSKDSIMFSYIPGGTDSIGKISNIDTTLYYRRKVISGDQWDYSNILKVKINKAKKPIITSTAQALIKGGTIVLSSTTANAYAWSNGEIKKEIFVGIAGKYAVTITDENGCKSTSDSISIFPPTPDVSNVTLIVGAVSNPTDISAFVKPSTKNAKVKFYSSVNGNTIAPPSIPSMEGEYKFLVAQQENNLESAITSLNISMIDPLKVLRLEKTQILQANLQEDASFLIGFRLKLTNLRMEQISSLTVKDDLSKVFPSGTKVFVQSVKISGKLVANTLYNGYSNIELLRNQSVIEGNKQDSIDLILKVYPNGFVGDLNNIAEHTSVSPFGTFKFNSFDSRKTSSPTLTGTATSFNIPKIDIFIPDGFSPNGDAINDRFVVIKPHNIDLSVQIFDRTGGMVYENLNYNNEWDGKSNQKWPFFGKELPNGTYFYVISATNKSTGKVRKFNGYLTLRR
jgi:gliding motility-associated-like protein